MRRVLILHVGPHKTGTSYIQQRLVADRGLLLARAKVVYPKSGQDVLHGHHSLATMFRDASPRLDEIRLLREELSTADTGLLSSERFSRLDRAQFARFRDHFPEYEIRAVAYLRVRSEMLVSRWAESIKHGMDWSFPEYLGKILVAPYESPIINQRLLLDVLADVFGRDHLDVLIYRPGTDLYVEFIRMILGAEAVMAESRGVNAVVNPSLPVHVTECLRLLHAMARARGRQDRDVVTARAMSYLEDPAHHAQLERMKHVFEERAGVIDISPVDRTFRHLDDELTASYADRVKNAGTDRDYPASKVREVRYLRDLAGGGAAELEDVLDGIYRGAFGESGTGSSGR
jgi:hypothetical protein